MRLVDVQFMYLLLLLSLLLTNTVTDAFSVFYDARRIGKSFQMTIAQLHSTRSRNQDHEGSDVHFLLQEFSIASGEIINPYDILKVSRKATRDEIRASYIKQSRRYHPDAFRNGKGNNNILPGSCNNLDDVRDQWERIKLSYEILSNPKTRRRYDRHDILSDPNAAMQRAIVNAAFDGISNVGKGIFGVGAFAVQAIIKGNDKNTRHVE